MITELKKLYGSTCMGLKVNAITGLAPEYTKQARFCEMVGEAFQTTFCVSPHQLKCAGARRSMGLLKRDPELIDHVHEESGIKEATIEKAINDIPRLINPPENVLMGITESMEKTILPDMYIIFTPPQKVMQLMKMYALKLDAFPVIKPYTFMSVCANVFVNTYLNHVISISFGCPESRKYGFLKEDQAVVGIPYETCLKLFG
jgi:uncharacterized protein (DUF169 family)